MQRSSFTAGILVGLLALTSPGESCDWGIDGGSQALVIPIESWHTAPAGKTLVELGYTVDGNSLVLIKKLEYTHPFLGTVSHDLDEKKARKFGVEEYSGVILIRVVEDSPADRAGLLKDDIVLRVDGEPVKSHQQFNARIRAHGLDTPLRLDVQHHGEPRQVSVPLVGKVKRETERVATELPRAADTRHTGLVVGELIPAVRTDLLGPDGQGLVVLDIRGGTPAFYSHIRRGDVIQAIDGYETATVEDLLDRIRAAVAGNLSVSLQVRRGNQEFVDVLRPEEDLTRDFRFKVPIVMNWKVTPRRTDFDLGLGLVLDYTREARVRAGRHEERSEFGLVLDLIKFESGASGNKFSLLWIPFLRW